MRQLTVITLLLLLGIHSLPAQTLHNTERKITPQNDEGYFQPGDDDMMILWGADANNIVGRYRSLAGYRYRLWIDPGRTTGFPVPLATEAMFRGFLTHIQVPGNQKDWCELVPSTWTAWTTIGTVPTACGAHTVTQERNCIASPLPCQERCPQQPTQTQTTTITNQPCQPPPPSCTLSNWSPSAGSVCDGTAFTQTRTLADCSIGSRPATGTLSCATTCTPTSWAPPRSSVCATSSLTQTRTLADCSTQSQIVTGTQHCAPSCTVTAWAPPRSTVCATGSLTQTRTLSDCSTEAQVVSGTQSCATTCTPTPWAPPRNSVCATSSLTQTRTLADCRTQSHVVTGTQNCAPSCTATAWAPPRSSVCSTGSLTQIRTLSDCSTGSQVVSGTQDCTPSCTPTAWSPPASGVCSTGSLTQTRTLSDCSTGSQVVSGTQNCAPSCTPTAWSPAASTVCDTGSLTQTRTLANCATDSQVVAGTQDCTPTPVSFTVNTQVCCTGSTLGGCTATMGGGPYLSCSVISGPQGGGWFSGGTLHFWITPGCSNVVASCTR